MCVNLSDKTIEALGYQKPRFLGRVKADVPVELVKAVSDVVALENSIDEIQSAIKLYR